MVIVGLSNGWRYRTLCGWSLIELLLGLALMLLLITATLPALGQWLWRQQLHSEQLALLAVARQARQLSLGSPGDWTLCMVSDTAADRADCQSVGDVGDEWILFDDRNRDGHWSQPESLAQRLPIHHSRQQLFASGRSSLRFANRWRAIDSGSVLLCNAPLSFGVRVILFQSGSIRLSTDRDKDGREDLNGTHLHCGD